MVAGENLFHFICEQSQLYSFFDHLLSFFSEAYLCFSNFHVTLGSDFNVELIFNFEHIRILPFVEEIGSVWSLQEAPSTFRICNK